MDKRKRNALLTIGEKMRRPGMGRREVRVVKGVNEMNLGADPS